jgi:hypothetical protein
MACCNRRRAPLASGPPAPAARAVPAARPPAPPSSLGSEVRLRFLGTRRVRVEGAVSGRIYRASPAGRLVTASQEDVRSLLRSGLFARV